MRTPDNFVEHNIGLGFDFIRATLDDPTVRDDVPNGAAIVVLPADDPELAEHNLGLALDAARSGFDVYIRHAIS